MIGFYSNIRASDNSLFGAGVARCLQPAIGLSQYGGQDCVIPDDIEVFDGLLGGRNKDGQEFIFDTIVHSCWMAEAKDLILTARKKGQKVYADIDDWYWGLRQSQMAFWNTHPKFSNANLKFFKENLIASDGIICSSKFLATKMSEIHKNVFYCPNMIDDENISWQRKKLGELRVGWIGQTHTRANDLEYLNGIIQPFLKKHNLKFHHSGALENTRPAYEILGIEGTSSPTVEYRDYPILFNPIDILLIPLTDTPFNYAKSYIRQLEASASLTPYIVSALPEQLEYKSGLKAKRPRDWIKYLEMLLDENFRTQLISENLKEVSKHNIKAKWNQWEFLCA